MEVSRLLGDGQRLGSAMVPAVTGTCPISWSRIAGRAGGGGGTGLDDACARCCTTIPHPALVAGSLLLHGRTVRTLLPLVERLAYFSKLPGRLLKPPTQPPAKDETLVQIETAGKTSK